MNGCYHTQCFFVFSKPEKRETRHSPCVKNIGHALNFIARSFCLTLYSNFDGFGTSRSLRIVIIPLPFPRRRKHTLSWQQVQSDSKVVVANTTQTILNPHHALCTVIVKAPIFESTSLILQSRISKVSVFGDENCNTFITKRPVNLESEGSTSHSSWNYMTVVAWDRVIISAFQLLWRRAGRIKSSQNLPKWT